MLDLLHTRIKSRLVLHTNKNEQSHDKTSIKVCTPGEDSDHPGQVRRLITRFAAFLKRFDAIMGSYLNHRTYSDDSGHTMWMTRLI